MVMPERLVPGMMATAWARPMMSAGVKVMSYMRRIGLAEAVARYISTPKMMAFQATISGTAHRIDKAGLLDEQAQRHRRNGGNEQ